MTFYQKLKKFLSLSVTDPKAWDISLWNLAGSQSLSGENVTEETSLTYSAVWNAVSLIAGTSAALPLHLMQRRGDQKRIADDRGIYRVLHDVANPFMTAMCFREALMGHVLIWGNGYAEIVRDGLGQVVELWPITPNRVRISMEAGEIFYTIKMPDGSPNVKLPRAKILHIPGLGFDGFQGYSVISMARKSIGLGMAMETFGSLYFGQGTHPGVVVAHPGTLSPPAYDNLKKSLVEAHSGLGQAHRLLLLEEGMKIEKLGVPPNDSQFIESRGFQIPEIARWFNLPPHKLKDLTRSSFCLPAQEEVYTQNGPKPIAHIIPGDRVWSLSDGKDWVLSQVTRSAITGFDEILRIKTTNRTLRCNAKHPILARVKNTDETWVSHWVPAGRLNVGDTIITMKNLPDAKTEIPKRQSGSEMSIPFVEFCGLLLGDGNVIRQNGNPSNVCIARADGTSYMDYYRNIARSEFRAGGYAYHKHESHPMAKLTEANVEEIRERGKNIRTNMDISRQYGVNICAIQNIIHRQYHHEHSQSSLSQEQVEEIKKLVANRETSEGIGKDFGVSRDAVNKILSGKLWRRETKTSPDRDILIREGKNSTRFNSALGSAELLSLGFGGKAHTKTIPSWIFQSPAEMRLALLRGFLDADGAVDKNGRINYSSCNQILLSQVRHLCMGLGIPVTNLRCQSGITTLPNGNQKEFHQWTFTCSDPGQNIRIGSHTPHYITRMEDGRPFNRKDRNYPKYGGEGFSVNGCSLARIVAIEKDPILQAVYDLSVKDTHSFIASGVVVHNSNIESEQISFVIDTILPWLVRLEQNFNMQLLAPNEAVRQRLYFKHVVEGLLRGDTLARATFYKEMFYIGAMSINEIREKEDLNPIEGGDIHLVPANMTTLENAGKQPVQPQLPGKPTQEPKPEQTEPAGGGNGKGQFLTLIEGEQSHEMV